MDKPEPAQGNVYFVNAAQILTKGRSQNTLSNAQADEIFDLYRTREDRAGLSRTVPISEIQSAGFSLKTGQYLLPVQVESKVTVAEALADLREKLAVQQQAQDHLETLLQKAGYL